MVTWTRYNITVFILCLLCFTFYSQHYLNSSSSIFHKPITTYIRIYKWLAHLTGSRIGHLATNNVRNYDAWSWNVLQSHTFIQTFIKIYM